MFITSNLQVQHKERRLEQASRMNSHSKPKLYHHFIKPPIFEESKQRRTKYFFIKNSLGFRSIFSADFDFHKVNFMIILCMRILSSSSKKREIVFGNFMCLIIVQEIPNQSCQMGRNSIKSIKKLLPKF